jgi:hypothetical protein
VRSPTMRLIVAAMGALLAVTVVAPTSWASYTPPDGVLFNRPADAGNKAAKYRIRNHTDATIRSVPRGGTIRVVQYAINFRSSADALIAAHRRGVNVRVLVDDRHNYNAHRRLKRALGTKTSNRSYFYVCKNGCRIGAGGALHSKFLTFTSAGSKRDIVMVSSANLTGPGATWGWNDNVTWSGNRAWYLSFVNVFSQMVLDRKVAKPYIIARSGPYSAYFMPQRTPKLSKDVIAKALSNVRCTGANGGAGIGGRTVVRVGMFGMIGDRGMYLARKLRSLDNQGCRVEVLLAKPSRKVIKELRRPGPYGGVAVHDTRYDRDGDGRPDKYIHAKYMMISGHYLGDRSTWTVFTGSQNWFPRSQTHDDEVVVQLKTRSAFNKYNSHFLDIWRNHSYLRPNKQLNQYSNFGQFGLYSADDPWPYLGPLPEAE